VDKLNCREFDVLVVGGGLVGMSCALALSRQGLSVGLLESKPYSETPQTSISGQDWDSRIYAISPANADWLASMGVWQHVDTGRICPIAQMQIFGDADSSHLQFDASEAYIDHLGFIVESCQLEQVLLAALSKSDVSLMTGVAPQSSVFYENHAEIHLADQRRLKARLLVAADGASSWLRNQAGIAISTYDYHQMGVVANFETELPHHNVAYQWFGDDGILAWLPLPGNRMSMVWSAHEKFARDMLELQAEALSEKVSQQGNMELGALKLLTGARAFPLRQQTATTLVKPMLVLVGDAAHTIHPLAGQGVNLGFRDVKVLAETLRNRSQQQSCGDLMLLRRYERARKLDLMEMQCVTKGLSGLFSHSGTVVRKLRNWGLGLTDRQAKVKKYLMNQAIR
jgi:ubiquinone biosynthesis UbiH/UbiF/VisC/COQ6 family hydroxylase